jgi:UDP-N-acetylmuramoyl-L-alanyl-D-glutamate--2,6-diaminopimelate ligase
LSLSVKPKPGMRKNERIGAVEARGMKIQKLLAGVDVVRIMGTADADIVSVVYDSRRARPGAIFFALRGEKTDGAKFIGEALQRGAVALASENPRPDGIPTHVTWIELAPGSGRRGLARTAANFYRHPADSLQLIGVTGTNGKTTTTFLVDSILREAGLRPGLIGTIEHRTPKGSRAAANTTPESVDLQQMFAEIRDLGGTHVVLEASSHALAMERLWGCHFGVAIFTNLTRDHMDYHQTFEEYFAAKRILFEGTGAGAPGIGVVNVDDPYAARITGLARRTLTYGLKGAPEVTARKFALSFDGLEFVATTPIGNFEVRSALVGRFNVYNILAAISAGIGLNVAKSKIEAGITKLQAVPGRFQRIDEGQPFLVIVDYAHTDDALRNLITTARELGPPARIITVFGAGGDRDRSKRPLMGEAAGSLSDLVVLTSDNPRGEDPLRIINDVLVGLQKSNAKYRVEPDREQAIAAALEEARPGDIVLLAGKGHETYQLLREGSVEFDDREKARGILRSKGYSKKRTE